jgi:hypothetical protein
MLKTTEIKLQTKRKGGCVKVMFFKPVMFVVNFSVK